MKRFLSGIGVLALCAGAVIGFGLAQGDGGAGAATPAGRPVSATPVVGHVAFSGIQGGTAALTAESDVLSYDVGLEQTLFRDGGGGGTSAGKANYKDFSVTKLIDAATPKLMETASKGLHVPTVTVSLVRPGPQNQQVYMKYELTNVLITSTKHHADATTPVATETLTLLYRQIRETYTTESGVTVTAAWDTVSNTNV